MPNLGTTELLIIAVVIMVLFGAKKLPDSARSLGRSMRIFKAETKGLRDDDDQGTARTAPPAAAAPIVPPVVPPAAVPPAAPVQERAADGSTPTTP